MKAAKARASFLRHTLARLSPKSPLTPQPIEGALRRQCLSAFLLFALVMVGVALGADAGLQKVNLKEAWIDGKLEITFIGRDEGERLELRIMNAHSTPLLLVIPEGTTTFPVGFGPGEISIETSAVEEVELPMGSEKRKVFKQTGTSRFKSGSVVLKNTKPR